MLNNIVLALVIVITIVAHVAIYQWVRFKISEGVILKSLQDAPEVNTVGALSAATGLKIRQVKGVCSRSAAIQCSQNGRYRHLSLT